MDVRLQDGTIVKNVPDGMTQSELMARLGAARRPAEAGLGDSAKRGLGLTARLAAEGLGWLPAAVGDAANAVTNLGISGVNKVAGTDIQPLGSVSGLLQRGLSDLPQPRPGAEAVFGHASRALASLPVLPAAAAASGVKALAPLAANLAQQAGGAIGAGLGGGMTAELTDDPALQMLGGFAGGFAGSKAAAGIEQAPEQARRLAAFARSKIDPSLSDVKQSKLLQGYQKVLENVPFVGDVVQAKEQARLAQTQQAAKGVAARYGEAQSPAAMGDQLQDAVEKYRYGKPLPGMTNSEIIKAPTYKTSVSAKEGALLANIPMKPDTKVPVFRVTEEMDAALSKYSNEGLAKEFADPTIARWKKIIDKSGGWLSWADLRQFRTDVRYLKNKPTLQSTIDDRALGKINSAITESMVNGAKQRLGDTGARMVRRADDYYAKAMDRVSKSLQSVFNAKNPEQAYGQMEKALLEGSRGDINKITALKRAMPPEQWGDVAATIIERMGLPPAASAEGFEGGVKFSINSFGTKFNAMSEAARKALFDTTAAGGEARKALGDLFEAVELMKGTERLANTSQAGSRLINPSTGGVIGLGALLVRPVETVAGVTAMRLSAKAFYSPTFIKLMTHGLKATTPAAKAQVAFQVAKFAKVNPEYKEDAESVINALSNGE